MISITAETQLCEHTGDRMVYRRLGSADKVFKVRLPIAPLRLDIELRRELRKAKSTGLVKHGAIDSRKLLNRISTLHIESESLQPPHPGPNSQRSREAQRAGASNE